MPTLDFDLTQAALDAERADPFRGLRKAEVIRREPGVIERLMALGQSFAYPQEVDIPGLGPENIQIGGLSRQNFIKGVVQALTKRTRNPEVPNLLDQYFGHKGVPRLVQGSTPESLTYNPALEDIIQKTHGRDVVSFFDPRLVELQDSNVRRHLNSALEDIGGLSEGIGRLFSQNPQGLPGVAGARQAIRDSARKALNERFRALGHKEAPEEFVVFRGKFPRSERGYNLANVSLDYDAAKRFVARGGPLRAYLVKKSDVVADTHALGSTFTTEFELMVPRSVLSRRKSIDLPTTGAEDALNQLMGKKPKGMTPMKWEESAMESPPLPKGDKWATLKPEPYGFVKEAIEKNPHPKDWDKVVAAVQKNTPDSLDEDDINTLFTYWTEFHGHPQDVLSKLKATPNRKPYDYFPMREDADFISRDFENTIKKIPMQPSWYDVWDSAKKLVPGASVNDDLYKHLKSTWKDWIGDHPEYK